MVRGGRAEAPFPRSDVSFRLDQKTGNFKVAIVSRQMQWGPLTEGKQKNELAQKEFRFIKTIIIIRSGNYSLSFASTSALLACFWFIGPEHNVWPLLLLLFCFGLGHNKVVLIRLKNANEYEYATQMDRM